MYTLIFTIAQQAIISLVLNYRISVKYSFAVYRSCSELKVAINEGITQAPTWLMAGLVAYTCSSV